MSFPRVALPHSFLSFSLSRSNRVGSRHIFVSWREDNKKLAVCLLPYMWYNCELEDLLSYS